MLEATVRVTNTLGLHARAAARLVRLAATFSSSLKIRRTDNDSEANAKDILSVLSIAASRGVVLQLIADGADESDAIEQVKQLFADNFGEQ
ncbi:MAG TPA: HPr family phosphocarrier protein [Pyrinomonadaceae bacterium]|nr:HPr family phosphocarrier protein [Pyrinomonadaceae bacterium]